MWLLRQACAVPPRGPQVRRLALPSSLLAKLGNGGPMTDKLREAIAAVRAGYAAHKAGHRPGQGKRRELLHKGVDSG